MIPFLRSPLKDGEVLDVAGRPVRLRVNRRAKRVSLRIDARTGEAVATAPTLRRLPQAEAFAREKAEWIARRLDAAPEAAPFAAGTTIPFRGGEVRLERLAGRAAARLAADAIQAGGDEAGFSRRVLSLLKAEAKAALTARTGVHAAALGLPAPTVSVIDARSRWGSCTPARGTIRYNWRLILSPDFVLDYVAAHETAHLVEANHSPAFWSVVERLYGDYRPARAWLKANGARLHAVGRG